MKFSQFFFSSVIFFCFISFEALKFEKKKQKALYKFFVDILLLWNTIPLHLHRYLHSVCLPWYWHRDFYFVILTCASCDSLFRQRYFVFSLLSDKCFYSTAYTNWWKSVVIITGFQCATLLCPSHLPAMTWAFLC